VAFPVYSSQFELARDTTAHALDPVPEGFLWVLRQITVYNGNALSAEVFWQLAELVSGAIFVEIDWGAGETGAQSWDGRIVLPPGQGLSWHADALTGSFGVDVYLGGYVLTLP
jgi:hypothetical protein